MTYDEAKENRLRVEEAERKIRHLEAQALAFRQRALDAEAKLARVEALVIQWARDAGPGSRAADVFGPQKVSVEFAVQEIRNALTPQDGPTDASQATDESGQGDEPDRTAGGHVEAARALRQYADDLGGNLSARHWGRDDVLHDIRQYAKEVEEGDVEIEAPDA